MLQDEPNLELQNLSLKKSYSPEINFWKNPHKNKERFEHHLKNNVTLEFLLQQLRLAEFSCFNFKEKSMRGSLELRELSARKLFSRLSGSF